MARVRSPLRVRKRQPFGSKGPTFTFWACVAAVRGAEFQNRRQPKLTAVVHPSTKHRDRWQVTYFEDGVPTSDTQETSCDRAVRELPPRGWRLRKVR